MKKINENVMGEIRFSFNDMIYKDFENAILKLDTNKAVSEDNIPTKILIKTNDTVSNHLSDLFNNAKNDHNYPVALKIANVIPIRKNDEKSLIKYYRPVRLIPIISKLFERNLYNQIFGYIDKSLSPYLFGFRKGYNTDQCLVIMLESWKKST